jgi:hypothetical protein
MEEHAKVKPQNEIDAFLLVEYEHFADSFWRTEELGEKRLNFFISLLTAAAAGLVILATSEKSGFSTSQVQWVTFATGAALLLFGVSTLLRMLRRNDVADQYKDALGLIRKSFSSRYGLEDYEPFEKLKRKLFTGGLAQTAALLNSMLVGAITAIAFLFTMSAGWLAVTAFCAFLLALAIQFAYIGRRHSRE